MYYTYEYNTNDKIIIDGILTEMKKITIPAKSFRLTRVEIYNILKKTHVKCMYVYKVLIEKYF